MKRISFIIDSFYLNNRIFDLTNKSVNTDNLLYQYYLLRKMFLEIGYQLDTYDLVPSWRDNIKLYFNYQSDDLITSDTSKSFLFMFEPEVVLPQLYDKSYHAKFNKIFTFCDELVDNKKYFKMNYSYLLPKNIEYDLNSKQKLCTLIAGNKISNHELELYSERIKAIRWFERNALDDFDLYGRGWDNYLSQNKFFRKICTKIPFIQNIIQSYLWNGYPSYSGEIDEKILILQKYKFSICYENARDVPGYITEKIFHCFFAGCVPIYWGADNVDKYIPSGCYIDKRNFLTYDSLYSYIKNMHESEYLSYLDNINAYLSSNQIKQFSASYFAENIIKEILHE